jgi:hypothetical protein
VERGAKRGLQYIVKDDGRKADEEMKRPGARQRITHVIETMELAATGESFAWNER